MTPTSRGFCFGISGAIVTTGRKRHETAVSGSRFQYHLFSHRTFLMLPDNRESVMPALHDATGNMTTCLPVACFDVGAVVQACLGMLLAVESRVIGVQVS